jgi:hypothetical protein
VENKHRLSLKESLFLGFCAVFMVVLRSVLRLHMNIPGHSMLFTVFFLMLARGCVNYRFSATATSLIAGALSILLGLGKGGPLILLKFMLPAIVVDIGATIFPYGFTAYAFCLILGVLAASTKFLDTYFIDYLIGMDPTVNLQNAVIGSLFGCLFGMAGSLFVPPVMAKLNAHGIIHQHLGSHDATPSDKEQTP